MNAKLRKCRIEKGLSVERMAQIIEVAPSTYYKWEDGSRNPSIKKAIVIARVLGRTVEELFFDSTLDKMSNEEGA
ncbi:MAG: helix-turn-helix domain-containing protein [Epulopiscium sp.]|nr:helix-turn-helix domain-containing protein [Candidatus Epulonipiscium sp.]